jgi:hypothetical protein
VRGKWGKRLRSPRRSRGWPELGQRRAEVAVRWRTGTAGGALRCGGGVPVARGPEGGEEAARKLLRVDVVLLVPLAGAKGLCSS